MRLQEIVFDMSQLQQYAQTVTNHGGIKEVYLIGSAVYSPTPNDIDLLYVLSNDKLNTPEDVEDYLQAYTNLDLDSYDSFFKVGDRFFHLSSGAGRSLVDNTEYARQQMNKGTVKLA
jgi:hypothetical protein